MTATIAELFKEYMAKMPDTFDTKKEIDLYFKDGLNSIVMERKAAMKADKTAKAAEKFIEKAKTEENAAKEAQEKVKKPKKEIDEAKAAKAAEKAAEKAKKAAEKAAEKEAEKAKKASVASAASAASAANAANAERKIFNDEMRIRIKEMFPDLNSKRTKIRIDELWKIQQDRM
jgi:outer membrane biosynthesis protein TonB